MSFHVSPNIITQFGSILGKQEEHSEAAQGYGKANLEITDSDDGWIAELLSSHEEVRSRVMTALEQLTAVCKENSLAMTKAAEYYRSTDEAQARRIDNAYPGVDTPPVPLFVGPFVLGEKMFPEGRLSAPAEPAEFQDPLLVVNTLSDLISPGYWAGEILNVLIGCNPAVEVSTRVAGDWVAFAKCGSAFNSLGFFCSDIGVNVKDNHRLLLSAWSGKAANASYDYFQRLAGSLENHKQAFESLRDSYQQAALGVWGFANVAEDLVQTIFDEVFWIVVEAVAGGILVETVVGPAVLWSIAALQCLHIARTWGRISELFEVVQGIIGTARAEILMVLSDKGGFTAHPLPGSYRHPAVK